MRRTDELNLAHLKAAVDEAAHASLSGAGLDLRVLPSDDRAASDAWAQSVARGFLDRDRSDEQSAHSFESAGSRRRLGVYDPSGPMPEVPVGTFASWIGDLSVPGDAEVTACAISAVTVAQTHHRRGIARAMMQGELNTAATLGVPVATLTVSESTLYGRYGFAPAAAAANWRIDRRRAGWLGPLPSGRFDYISRERWAALAPALHERVRRHAPGELSMPASHWTRFARTHPGAHEPGAVRAVQYTDDAGTVTGLVLYTVQENHDDYTKSGAQVQWLVADGPDAYAALWHFLLHLDLVGELRAGELSVDEPLWWLIADQRAAQVSVTDHHYVRVLDVPAALEARRYQAADVIDLTVTDPLGHAQGRWVLDVDESGQGSVHPLTGDSPQGAVRVGLGVQELSAAYLGGVSLATLAYAGRIETNDAFAAARVFAWPVPPRLSYWY